MEYARMRTLAFLFWLLIFSTLIYLLISATRTEVLLALAILVLLFLIYQLLGKRMIVEFKEYERGVVFRLGKFSRVVGPGIALIIPGIESYKKLSLRVETVDVGAQEVVTADQIKLMVDAVIYMRVLDPKRAVLEVEDYKDASTKLIQARLRDVMGKLTLMDAIGRIEEINEVLKRSLQEVTKDWGIDIYKVEIQKIEVPKEVIEAMHERRRARELKYATEEKALAKEIMIEAIDRAASKMSPKTLTYMYLETLQRMAEGKATKIIFPLELSRLAETLAGKMGVSTEEAMDKVVGAYKEVVREELEKKGRFEKIKEKVMRKLEESE